MPHWFVSRPIENCNESELIAYKALNSLDDSWTIRWGYQYLHNNTPREGDFLILGPDGRLLVLEIKMQDRVYPRTGKSDSGAPLSDEDQVQRQKAGVIAALTENANKNNDLEVPYVISAIFSVNGNTFKPSSKVCPFATLSGPDTLSKLPDHWEKLTAGGRDAENLDNIHQLFALTYGDASPEAEAKFLSATDKMIFDRLTAHMTLLESLGANRQILVQGGAGSGKSWLAERFAQQLAASGKNVLFLCYNKALGAGFQRDLAKAAKMAKPTAGRITVHTWESFVEELVKKFGKNLQPKPKEKAKLEEYYEKDLPEAMLEAVTGDSHQPRFDALVVDEGQDHNTEPSNWWEIYHRQLHDGPKATMGIFYDEAQRPSFRKGSFNIAEVASILSQPAHFRMLETRRYTRPVFEFLKSLESDQTQVLVEGLHPTHLLVGPEVIIQEHPHLSAAKSAAAAQLKKWFKHADPSDTLVLTRMDPFGGKTPVFTPCETFAGRTLVPADAPHAFDKGNLRAASFNKSKGLDARAVILLDTHPWPDLPPQERVGFWIAASRARQLLAIFATEKSKKPNP